MTESLWGSSPSRRAVSAVAGALGCLAGGGRRFKAVIYRPCGLLPTASRRLRGGWKVQLCPKAHAARRMSRKLWTLNGLAIMNCAPA